MAKGKFYKVRFHLQNGKNYMKWQIKDERGSVHYYDPEAVNIIMLKATLENRRNTAEKIKRGANKTVCGWVRCLHIEVVPRREDYDGIGITLNYNPRVNPFWEYQGESIDNSKFATLITEGRKVKALIPKHER
jgi:hypothetical protein